MHEKIDRFDYKENKNSFYFLYNHSYYYGIFAFILFFVLWKLSIEAYQFILKILNTQFPYAINVLTYMIIFPVIGFYIAHSITLCLIERKASLILKDESFILITNKTKKIAYSDVQNIIIHLNKSGGLEPEDSHWSPISITYTIQTKHKKYKFTSSLREGWKHSTFSTRYNLIKPVYSLDIAMSALIQKCPSCST